MSGRGVGMDVVRTNIEKIGGTIELTAIEGKGTKFTIKIPLTLAIVSALIVECGGERFAVPQLSVVELVRAAANSEHTIERINETPVLRLRNRLLPLVSLRELLHLEPVSLAEDSADDTAVDGGDGAIGEGDEFIIVAKIGTYSMGIIVDRVFDTEEIVVKPVAPILRDLQLFSGNTILGDGSVVMILDPNGIAAATGEISVADDTDTVTSETLAAKDGDLTTMLVFRAVDEAPKAVPLNLIARLEEVDLATVELSNGQYVVQYRGHLMPLVCMEVGKTLEKQGRQPVLVFTDGQRTMGLVVDEIVDIVEDYLKIELSTDREGYMGTAVIDRKASDIIDASYYLTQAYPDWFDGGQSDGEDAGETRVLLIDDSPFFRNLLKPLLTTAGYEVVCTESADAALELCRAGEKFDNIVSDIEMPGMSGFEFAEHIKSETHWRSTPMVALSSYAKPRDLERGRRVGFSDYVSKTDREALLQTLSETLSETRGAA